MDDRLIETTKAGGGADVRSAGGPVARGVARRPGTTTVWRAAATDALACTMAGGAAAYDRARTLPRLIAFDTRDLASAGPALDRSILARLKRALRAERRRGRQGSWTYDLNRHLALLQAIAAEDATLGARRDAKPAAIKQARVAPPAAPETKSAARTSARTALSDHRSTPQQARQITRQFTWRRACRAAGRGPSSSRVRSVQRRSSAQP